jgi:hypothetical protein
LTRGHHLRRVWRCTRAELERVSSGGQIHSPERGIADLRKAWQAGAL